jgi:hypothetical protein
MLLDHLRSIQLQFAQSDLEEQARVVLSWKKRADDYETNVGDV